MLLLFIDSLLLILITINMGILAQAGLNKLFRCKIQSDPLIVFLMGLFLSTIYLNIVSFWFPVDYRSLAPLLFISIFIPAACKKEAGALSISFQASWRLVRANWLIGLCLFILLFLYWIKPPTNPDSAGYHYLCILWYEKFKAVPGLANLDGRYAFNPAAFIIQSAYSFSGPVGQAIYPLNGVITGLFLSWLAIRLIRHRHSPAGLAYLILLFIFARLLMGNMSSAASDPLAQICLAYPIIRLFEMMLAEDVSMRESIPLCIILLFAPIAKLTSYPAWFVLVLIFYIVPGMGKKALLFKTLLLLSLILYIPWIGRNYIMSGYPVYPFPSLDLFHPDWKVSRHVLMFDYDQIKYEPRLDIVTGSDPESLSRMTFRGWFFPWLSTLTKAGWFMELFLFFAALASPFLWLVAYSLRIRPRIQMFLLWLILYVAVWLWLIGSPDFRFGTVILSLSFILPLIWLGWDMRGTWGKSDLRKALTRILPVCVLIFTLYYVYGAIAAFAFYAAKKDSPYTWRNGVLLPLRNIHYADADHEKDIRAGFPYKVLPSGIKLYLEDTAHFCINADIPCQSKTAAGTEMRGDRLDEGFRPAH